MKKSIFFVLLVLFNSFLSFAKTVSLEEALSKKWAKATVVMQRKGNSDGRNLKLSLTNLTKAPLSINVPVGFVFEAQDSMVQDFIHLESQNMNLAALSTDSTFLKALCIRASLRSPYDGDAFLAKSMASSTLLSLAVFAYEQKLYDSYDMQSALWAVSDDYDLAGIENKALVKFVAEKLNKPLPDYTVKYKFEDVAGRTAAAALVPLEIDGLFEYTLSKDQKVKLDLVDTMGASVLTKFNFVQIMSQTKGRHRFTFNFKLTRIPRGTYYVKMMGAEDGQECGSKEVVF